MNTRLVISSALALVAASAPAAALTTDFNPAVSRYTIDIVGFVPVVCRANVDATSLPTAAGTVNLGSLHEFCNSPSGYRVHADYSPSLANATLLVDGAEIKLNADGTSVVSSSTSAAIANRSVSLELPQGVEGGNISFRIEPI